MMIPSETIRQAVADLEHVDEEIRARAINILADERYKPAVPRLVTLITEDEVDPGTRFMIVKALGRMADEAAIPVLLEVLRMEDLWSRAAATGALIEIGEASIEGLVVALRDEEKAVRRAAAKALGKIAENGHGTAGVEHGLSFALLDVDAGVRRFAAEALGRLGAESKVAELRQVLDDRNTKVRMAAFKALANINTPEAQAAVRNWVKNA